MKVVVAAMFDSETTRLTETERIHLVALLQLLESAYKEDIWENLHVVSFQNGGKAYNVCLHLKITQNVNGFKIYSKLNTIIIKHSFIAQIFI